MTFHPHTLGVMAEARQADLAREALASHLGRLATSDRATRATRVRHALLAIAASVAIVLGIGLA